MRRVRPKPPPPPSAPHALVAWARGRFHEEMAALVPRVALLRGGRVLAYELSPTVDRLGSDGAVQAAAIFARTAADDEHVALLIKALFETDAPDPSKTKKGFLGGPQAMLLVETRTGIRYGRMFQAQRVTPHQLFKTDRDVTPDEMRQFANWNDPGFFVDPAIDDLFASKGLPGAVRRVARARPAVLMPEKQASADPRPPMPPTVDTTDASPTTDEATLVYPWEAARAHRTTISSSFPSFGTSLFAFLPAAEPTGLYQRTLDDLLANGWSSEAQACLLAQRVTIDRDPRAALQQFLASDIPPLAKLQACAALANTARLQGQTQLMIEAARELVTRLDALAAPDGGVLAWLDKRWPADPRPGSEIGVAAAVQASCAAVWRWVLWPGGPEAADGRPGKEALAGIERLRDYLLDKSGAPPAGTPGERVARLAAIVLSAVPSPDGEPRLERWHRIAQRHPQAPFLTFRDFGAYHAAVLHSCHAVFQLIADRAVALRDGDLGTWLPERIPIAGLLEEAVTILARHAVQKAARLHPDDADAALRLLGHARALCRGDETIAACHDEARFRARRWDEALVADLARATKDRGSLGACAEYLRVAAHLGRRRDVTIAARRLRAKAAVSPHAWMADVRVSLARPGGLGDLAHVTSLCEGRPPEKLDSADRAVFALYGAEPSRANDEVLRELRGRKDALEQADQLRQERVEEILTRPPRERRPDVPGEVGEGAAARAIGALRIRLDRPWLARHALKPALEAHAARAGQLDGHADAPIGGWLAALGDDRGLVPLLDRAIRGDDEADSTLAAALERAGAELEAVVQSVWTQDLFERTRDVWALLSSVGEADALRERTRGIEASAAEAASAAGRDKLDRELTSLLEEASAAQRRSLVTGVTGDSHAAEPVDSESAAADADAADDDGFAPMEVGPRAVHRSRDELGTPEWAIAKGLTQVLRYNLARGSRDLKMLRGTRGDEGALWELRTRDGRLPVRLMYVLGEAGPRVVAILAKQDDAHQRRMIERVTGWLRGEGRDLVGGSSVSRTTRNRAMLRIDLAVVTLIACLGCGRVATSSSGDTSGSGEASAEDSSGGSDSTPNTEAAVEGSSADAPGGPTSCETVPCAGNTVCVKQWNTPPSPPGYTCIAIPSSCEPTPTCGCVKASIHGYCSCATVDSGNILVSCQVPP